MIAIDPAASAAAVSATTSEPGVYWLEKSKFIFITGDSKNMGRRSSRQNGNFQQ